MFIDREDLSNQIKAGWELHKRMMKGECPSGAWLCLFLTHSLQNAKRARELWTMTSTWLPATKCWN